MSYCSPKYNKNKLDTCFRQDIIKEMITLWNKKNPNNKLSYHNNHTIAINNIRNKIKNKAPCEEEYCWLELDEFMPIKDRLEEHFRPPVPKSWNQDKTTWLNTLDIIAVMNQYQFSNPNFKFIGVSPIDFDTKIKDNDNLVCVERNLCELSIKDLLNDNINNFGVIFNLDKHDEGGSHWTALYCNINDGNIYYYDSASSNLPNEVFKLMYRVAKEINNLQIKNKIKIKLNNRFQINVKNTNDNRIEIPLETILEYFLIDHNFINYRFGYVEYFNNIWNDAKFNLEINDKIEKNIIEQLFHLIEITENDRYIDDLNYNSNISTDKFVKNSIRQHIEIALNNFIKNLSVLLINNKALPIDKISLKNNKLEIEVNQLKEIENNIEVYDISTKMYKNYIQHQFENTECGIYSINFITNFIENNKTFNEIIEEPIPDNEINKLRYKKYYRPNIKNTKF